MKKADSWARNRELGSAKVKKCRKTLARERLLKHGEDFPKLPTQRASLQQRKQASKELLQVAQLNRKTRGAKRDAQRFRHPSAILTILRGTGWRNVRAGRQWNYNRCDLLQLQGTSIKYGDEHNCLPHHSETQAFTFCTVQCLSFLIVFFSWLWHHHLLLHLTALPNNRLYINVLISQAFFFFFSFKSNQIHAYCNVALSWTGPEPSILSLVAITKVLVHCGSNQPDIYFSNPPPKNCRRHIVLTGGM